MFSKRRYLFVLLSALIFVFVAGCSEEEIAAYKADKEQAKEEKRIEKEQKKAEKEQEKKDKEEEKAVAEEEKRKEEQAKEEADQEKEAAEEIADLVKTIVKEDLEKTKVLDVQVNENLGKADGSYIVMPNLKWTRKNGADRTKEMLEMYSDNIAAKLAGQNDVSEITVFWEVPYHRKDDNVAKFMYERSGESMIKMDQWFGQELAKK